MYHMIEFNAASTSDTENRRSSAKRSEPLRAQQITRAIVRLCPNVVEINRELVEVADLHFKDGTIAAQVPFARFHFVE